MIRAVIFAAFGFLAGLFVGVANPEKMAIYPGAKGFYYVGVFTDRPYSKFLELKIALKAIETCRGFYRTREPLEDAKKNSQYSMTEVQCNN